jgi:HEAT repeat protein
MTTSENYIMDLINQMVTANNELDKIAESEEALVIDFEGAKSDFEDAISYLKDRSRDVEKQIATTNNELDKLILSEHKNKALAVVLEQLVHLLKDESEGVRLATIAIIGRIAFYDNILFKLFMGPLSAMLQDKAKRVRCAAIELIDRMINEEEE